MKVAIVTSGILPVPPVKGGAVENLVKFYLDYNETQTEDIQITVYSVSDSTIGKTDLLKYEKTKFVFIDMKGLISKMKQQLFRCLKSDFYYHHSWEYFAAAVAKKIKKENFDIIVIENRPGFIFRLSKCSDAKFVLHLHNDFLNKTIKRAPEILNSYNKIIAISRYIKDRVDEILLTSKVEIVYNGIDLVNFRNPSHADITRKSFHLSEDDFLVVYTGRIEPMKGVKELLEAFRLLSAYDKIKLLIVGGGNGNINRGDFFLEMYNLASSLPGKVVFVGFQSYEKMPNILHLCDMAVVPSIWEEPFSLTSLEDMAVGLPLLVTKSGGILEVVNQECAIVLDKDYNLPSIIAKALLSLYKDADKRAKMSEAAKERSNLFSKEKYAINFIKKIRTCV